MEMSVYGRVTVAAAVDSDAGLSLSLLLLLLPEQSQGPQVPVPVLLKLIQLHLSQVPQATNGHYHLDGQELQRLIQLP